MARLAARSARELTWQTATLMAEEYRTDAFKIHTTGPWKGRAQGSDRGQDQRGRGQAETGHLDGAHPFLVQGRASSTVLTG